MMIPDNLRYSKEHEWIEFKGKIATIGVTDHAQDQLGDIVFVELPDIGQEFSAGEAFGVLESVKAVSDCYVPISGKVLEVNDLLTDAPQTVNEDCYGEGWMMRLEVTNPDELEELMDQTAYSKYINEEST
ncbi:MAG: glycine cleavage system protein H [Deltaproteobacteria bacterium RIFCSPLOWO2_02_FULL_44_10]|nr:MAG: glycine cleavage system protein H [Deltaproteobacteria bacterium RIFCSPLOWO2_02_FULL_44_10]